MNDDITISFLKKMIIDSNFIGIDSSNILSLADIYLSGQVAKKNKVDLSEKLASGEEILSWSEFLNTGDLNGAFPEFPLNIQDIEALNAKLGNQVDFKYYLMKCIEKEHVSITGFDDLVTLKNTVKLLPALYINILTLKYINSKWLKSSESSISSQLRDIPLRDYRLGLEVIDENANLNSSGNLKDFLKHAKKFTTSDVKVKKIFKFIIPLSFIADKLQIKIRNSKNFVEINENNVLSFLSIVVNEILDSELFLSSYKRPEFQINIKDDEDISSVQMTFDVADEITEADLKSMIFNTLDLLPSVFEKSEISNIFSKNSNGNYRFPIDSKNVLKEVVVVALSKLKSLKVFSDIAIINCNNPDSTEDTVFKI